MSTVGATTLLAGLLVLAACIFVAMLFLFAQVTGWRRLARRYPAASADGADRYRVDGVTLGAWGWNAPPLRAGLDDVGIVLRAVVPFSLAFRPVRLPWSAIRSVSYREYMFFRVLVVRYGAGDRAQLGFVPSALVTMIEARLGAQIAAPGE